MMPIPRDEFKELKKYNPEEKAKEILSDGMEHSTTEIAAALNTTVEHTCLILDGLGKKVPISKRIRSGVYWWRLQSKGSRNNKYRADKS